VQPYQKQQRRCGDKVSQVANGVALWPQVCFAISACVAIVLDEKDATIYIYRGLVYEKMHDFKSALKDYDKSKMLDSLNPESWYNIGNVHFKLEKYQNSIKYYSRSLFIDPEQPKILYNRGLSYHYINDIESACYNMKKALEMGFEESNRYIKKNCK